MRGFKKNWAQGPTGTDVPLKTPKFRKSDTGVGTTPCPEFRTGPGTVALESYVLRLITAKFAFNVKNELHVAHEK